MIWPLLILLVFLHIFFTSACTLLPHVFLTAFPSAHCKQEDAHGRAPTHILPHPLVHTWAHAPSAPGLLLRIFPASAESWLPCGSLSWSSPGDGRNPELLHIAYIIPHCNTHRNASLRGIITVASLIQHNAWHLNGDPSVYLLIEWFNEWVKMPTDDFIVWYSPFIKNVTDSQLSEIYLQWMISLDFFQYFSVPYFSSVSFIMHNTNNHIESHNCQYQRMGKNAWGKKGAACPRTDSVCQKVYYQPPHTLTLWIGIQILPKQHHAKARNLFSWVCTAVT